MKKEERPYTSTARNSRRQLYKYYKAGELKRVAVVAGRCRVCGKITDDFCSSCQRWMCEKHLAVKSDIESCCPSCGSDGLKEKPDYII